MLAGTPALTGIHVSGGGQDGVIGALRDEREGRNIIAVCNELTANTKSALIDGTVDLVLVTPIGPIASRSVALMARGDIGPASEGAGQVLRRISTSARRYDLTGSIITEQSDADRK